MKKVLYSSALSALILALALPVSGMIRNGKTSYVIVTPDNPDTGCTFAAKELAYFLKKASGSDFKIVPEGKAPGKNRIFLGISSKAKALLKGDPRKNLKAQEHCVKTIGRDLFLYGKGSWGEMFAVYDYLENVLAYRFYDARGGMRVPDLKTYTWKSCFWASRYPWTIKRSSAVWTSPRQLSQ